MLCVKPFMLGSMECSCGKCLPCLIDRRRLWAHRILLESFKHGDSCFVTLTYDNEHCPEELQKVDYQNWLKRLRKSVAPQKIRYFVAGEYGELSGRPHFHAAIFGLDSIRAGGFAGQNGLVKESWPFGFTYVGELTWESAQYIAGYLTKKVNKNVHDVKEFARMSLRPGLGSKAMDDVATALATDVGLDDISEAGDVPFALLHGKRLLPLGRYLRRELRGKMGFGSKDTPSEAARMFAMRKADEKAAERKIYSTEMILDMRSQKMHNRIARFKVKDFKRRLR